jgi:hypothetical protein
MKETLTVLLGVALVFATLYCLYNILSDIFDTRQ